MNRVLYQLSYAAIYSLEFRLAEISFVIISNRIEFVKRKFRIFLDFLGKIAWVIFMRQIAIFLLGGTGYVGLEYLWRGRSHISMFVAGGICFLLLGRLTETKPRLPWAVRCLLGAGIITVVELAAGLIANRDYRVWDYRQLPMNFQGQVCLVYSLLWIPVSFGAMLLYRLIRKKLLPDR